jgi:hypothetical protein
VAARRTAPGAPPRVPPRATSGLALSDLQTYVNGIKDVRLPRDMGSQLHVVIGRLAS